MVQKRVDKKNFIKAVELYRDYSKKEDKVLELGVNLLDFTEPLFFFVDEYFSTYFTDEEIDKVHEMIDKDLDAELILKTIIKGRLK